jgi:hypothetical protein
MVIDSVLLFIYILLMIVFSNEAPPEKREKKDRLTPELKKIKPGQSISLDVETAACLAAFIRYHGGKARRQKKDDGQIKIWSI